MSEPWAQDLMGWMAEEETPSPPRDPPPVPAAPTTLEVKREETKQEPRRYRGALAAVADSFASFGEAVADSEVGNAKMTLPCGTCIREAARAYSGG